jgi:purine-binding chemotaxis protein CheW
MQSSVLSNPSTAEATKTDPRAGKYLAFQLASEEFAVQVLHLREITGVQEITAAPQMPIHVKGVLNLRGKIIPVVDLRVKFGMQELEYTQRTCIIVVQIEGQAGRISGGIIVDGITEVLSLQSADIEDTPDFGMGATTPYILGVAKIKGKVKILLDIDKVIQEM